MLLHVEYLSVYLAGKLLVNISVELPEGESLETHRIDLELFPTLKKAGIKTTKGRDVDVEFHGLRLN